MGGKRRYERVFINDLALALHLADPTFCARASYTLRAGTTRDTIAFTTHDGLSQPKSASVYSFLFAASPPQPSLLRIIVLCDVGQEFTRDRELAAALWGRLLRGPDFDDEQKLTPQERRVFQLIRNGLRYKEIAAELGVAHATIRVQAANIRKVLGRKQLPALRRTRRKPN
jgi:Bacterial regulatory proteins, luxR family